MRGWRRGKRRDGGREEKSWTGGLEDDRLEGGKRVAGGREDERE